MFSQPRFNSPFGKFMHPFRTGCFCARYTSVTCFVSSSHFPVGSSGYLPHFQVSSEPGPIDVHEVSRLELSEVSCISFRVLQKLCITSFRFFWRCRNFVHHSHEHNSMWAGFWTEMLPICTFTLSNRLINVEHYLVRFAAKKYVEYELNLFSICCQEICGR